MSKQLDLLFSTHFLLHSTDHTKFETQYSSTIEVTDSVRERQVFLKTFVGINSHKKKLLETSLRKYSLLKEK